MWTGGHFEEQLQKAKGGPPPEENQQKWPGVNILGPGSYFPIGLEGAEEEDEAVDWRIAGLDRFGNQPSVLLHPAFIKEDGSLQVFSSAPPNSVVRLLVGTAQSLVNNISVVSDSLDERALFAREHVLGCHHKRRRASRGRAPGQRARARRANLRRQRCCSRAPVPYQRAGARLHRAARC